MISTSGFSNPASALYVPAPIVLSAPSTTGAETALLFGSAEPRAMIQAYEGGEWVDLPDACRMIRGRFFYPAILQVGANDIRLRAVSGVQASEETVHTVVRMARHLFRPKKTRVFLGSEDVTDYASEVQAETDGNDGVSRISFTLTGYHRKVSTSETAKILLDDGAVSREYTAAVLTRESSFTNEGKRIQKVVAQEDSDKLRKLVLTTTFAGRTNGYIIEQIAKAAGFQTVFAPQGGNYTGARTVGKSNVYDEIMAPVLFVEDWITWPIDKETIAFLPSYVRKFVFFTYSDDYVVELSETEDRAFIVNNGRAVYQESEEDLNIKYDLGNFIPSMVDSEEVGHAWYASDNYGTEVSSYSPKSVIFFGLWGPGIDWKNIERGVLKIKFSNTVNQVGGSRFSYDVDLETFPEKQFAAGYFDLRRYHLESNVTLFYAFVLSDKNGNKIGNLNLWRPLSLTADTDANFTTNVTKFGIVLSEPELLATFDKTWVITTDAEEGPQSSVDGVIYSRYDQLNDDIDFVFYVEVEVNDVAFQTIVTDLDAEPAGSDSTRLQNCELSTEENISINGNEYVYGVISHSPNSPVKRVDKLVFKFKSKVRVGGSIKCKFSVWGRRFVSSAGYEDPDLIDVKYQNDASVASYGLKDQAILVSCFWSSIAQARSRLVKFVDARSGPIFRCTLSVPSSIELRAGMTFRVFSAANGGFYNSYYVAIRSNPSDGTTNVEAIRAARVFVDDATIQPHPPDISFSLTDLLKELTKTKSQFQFGTVAAQKYRGMFRVELDNGTEIRHVISRVEGVKAGDKVAVLQTPEGSWIIIEIVSPSTMNREFEEEDEDFDKLVDDSVPFDQLPDQATADKPLPNYITVKSFKPDKGDEKEIPSSGVKFILELSHDCDCTAYGSKNGFDIRDHVFIRMKLGKGYVQSNFIGKKLAPNRYEFRPRGDFSYDHVVEIGLMATSDTGTSLMSLDKKASLHPSLLKTWSFMVEPEFKVDEITVLGPGERIIRFTGRFDPETVTDPMNYYIIPVEE